MMPLKFGRRPAAESDARSRAKAYDDAIRKCGAQLRDVEKNVVASPEALAQMALEGGIDVEARTKAQMEVAALRDTLEGLLRLRAGVEPELWLIELDELQSKYDQDHARVSAMVKRRRDLELEIERLDREIRGVRRWLDSPSSRINVLQRQVDEFNLRGSGALAKIIADIRERLLGRASA